ncbi:diphosphate--fructose-6-phosphate 1-phosphotransferase [Neochlamydia sp. S13]|uniref:diphosphate--fructose-6-phosphate 1-phosphotransferase n=1 Tax=Neochlamydia sp. S13 TaxID=1353976 RepID=UPI0005A803F4|nr:diphosphate--fructose-6-phosphate 1-phosphotransferase [Neochlamydia sp. S13]BBI17091.1 Pyrophosphate--fructose 6-phosphate 1-phosphotransferase subunit beta [Neochlamydia sp. S13]
MPSTLQKIRMEYQPLLPPLLNDIHSLALIPTGNLVVKDSALAHLFPHTYQRPHLKVAKSQIQEQFPMRIGFVFSGGQAAGGHNIASGLFDSLKKLHVDSQLFGFLGGPDGIVKNKYIEINAEVLASYRNQGGFNLIGAGRTKIETSQQFLAAAQTVKDLKLDGLVIVGGDDSNTNAALLAEYFLSQGMATKVIGVPKTIDGDLKNEFIELSFGFDSATKTYSEFVGNILVDALSAEKYTFFIKLMGRTASHIVLEVALNTHPNLALIGEEVEAQGWTLQDITHIIADLIIERAKSGKNYGAILIPEGLIEFIPEYKILIKELNTLLSTKQMYAEKIESLIPNQEKINYIKSFLSLKAQQSLQTLPEDIQMQLLLDRDPHGNVQVAKIDTERLLIETVRQELTKRLAQHSSVVKFNPQPLFCGYEGRACLPSNFDSQYCYTLGHLATLLIQAGATGYMACIQKLNEPIENWELCGVPLVSMIHLEERHGKTKPVIKKALVELTSPIFNYFKQESVKWRLNDDYINPGPMQFFGPEEITHSKPFTLMNKNSR